jgi:hypothetical protein
VPTQSYLAAVELWNNTKTRGTLEVTADPAKAKKITDLSDVDVAKGTKARQLAEVSLAGKPMVKIETLDEISTTRGRWVLFIRGPRKGSQVRARRRAQGIAT